MPDTLSNTVVHQQSAPCRPRTRAPYCIALLVGFAVWLARPARLVDGVWSDLWLANQRLAAGPDVVIVNITENDILMHGRDRLSRTYIAQSLQRLAEAQAARVVLDCNLAGDLSAEEEMALLAAADALDVDRLALGYEPIAELRPKKSLLKRVSTVDLRLVADSDGRFRRLLNPLGTQFGDPALWLASGRNEPGETPFDLRIDPNSFRTVTLGDLHEPNFDLASLGGKRVVVSMARTLGKSRANLPVHGMVDRGSLVAMATQAHLTGFPARERLSHWLGAGGCFSCLWAGFWIGSRARTVAKTLGCFSALSSACILASVCCMFTLGGRTEPSTATLVALSGLTTALAYRLGIADLASGFLAGNMSPEEVWIWRTKADSTRPVLLLNAAGNVKRANQQAREAFGLAVTESKTGPSELALLCMPGLGQRARRLVRGAVNDRVWDLEWPHDSIPLVVFHDVTITVAQREELHRRLHTDPLTGALNRAGFEAQLNRLDRSGSRDYAVLFLDMNGFKEVNDVHGHDVGDALLNATAARFSAVLAGEDYLARMGGDEFAVLLEGRQTYQSLRLVCSKLEAALDDPVDVGVAVVKVGVAVGCGVPLGEHDKPADVVRRADAAMYARKAQIKGARPPVEPLESVC